MTELSLTKDYYPLFNSFDILLSFVLILMWKLFLFALIQRTSIDNNYFWFALFHKIDTQ